MTSAAISAGAISEVTTSWPCTVKVRRKVLRSSRATVAAAMLDEAESPLGAGQTVVPLDA